MRWTQSWPEAPRTNVRAKKAKEDQDPVDITTLMLELTELKKQISEGTKVSEVGGEGTGNGEPANPSAHVGAQQQPQQPNEMVTNKLDTPDQSPERAPQKPSHPCQNSIPFVK